LAPRFFVIIKVASQRSQAISLPVRIAVYWQFGQNDSFGFGSGVGSGSGVGVGSGSGVGVGVGSGSTGIRVPSGSAILAPFLNSAAANRAAFPGLSTFAFFRINGDRLEIFGDRAFVHFDKIKFHSSAKIHTLFAFVSDPNPATP